MSVGSPENGVDEREGAADRSPPELILCPYCGQRQEAGDQCASCHGLFDPLSRQATQNQMGPWFVRNERNPFAPGMSYERIRQMAQRGRLKLDSVVRGPSTRQFWTVASKTPGVACLLGECHNCHAGVDPDEYMCRVCGVVLAWSSDRQQLGLSPVKLLPGEAPAAEVASSGMGGGQARPETPTRDPGPARAARPRPATPAGPAPEPRSRTLRIRPAGRGRGRRGQQRAQRNALIAVVGFSALVVSLSLIAVFGFGVGVGEPAGASAAPPETPPQPAPVSPAASSSTEWLSPEAETALGAYAARLNEARDLSASSAAQDVQQAVLLLREAQTDAESSGISPAALAELDALLHRLRARADELRLRELIGG